MKCTVCGTENPDNARFCGICGNPFADSAATGTEINSSIPDTTETDTNTEETHPEPNITADPYEPHVGSFPTAPAEPLPNENSDVNTSDGQPPVYAIPTPLPSEPKRSVYSSSGSDNAFVPTGNAAPPSKSNVGKHEKEKKVVSLSVAVICIVAVFILAVICGILTQLYTKRIRTAASSGTASSSYQASYEVNACL